MSKLIDLTGKRFYYLTAIKRVENDSNNMPRWLCRCDCGKEKVIRADKLRGGEIKSCGCKRYELAAQTRPTHKMSNTPIWHAWHTLRQRCNNPNDKDYKHYGGRGIAVCKEWNESFEAFYRDMGPTYKEGLQIDRINNNGNYEPNNCHWTTVKENINNRRNTVFVTLPNNQKILLSELAKKLNIPYSRLYMKLKRGCPIELLLKS